MGVGVRVWGYRKGVCGVGGGGGSVHGCGGVSREQGRRRLCQPAGTTCEVQNMDDAAAAHHRRRALMHMAARTPPHPPNPHHHHHHMCGRRLHPWPWPVRSSARAFISTQALAAGGAAAGPRTGRWARRSALQPLPAGRPRWHLWPPTAGPTIWPVSAPAPAHATAGVKAGTRALALFQKLACTLAFASSHVSLAAPSADDSCSSM